MIFSLLVIAFTGVFGCAFCFLGAAESTTSLVTLGCLSTIIFFELPQELSEQTKINSAIGCQSLKLATLFFGVGDSWI